MPFYYEDEFFTQLVFPNAQKNMFLIGNKVFDIISVITHSDVNEDNIDIEMLSECDRLGEDYGAIISALIGFEKVDLSS